MKPVALFGYQMQNSTKSGDVVLDSFGGSGTTMIAAEQCKRKSDAHGIGSTLLRRDHRSLGEIHRP